MRTLLFAVFICALLSCKKGKGTDAEAVSSHDAYMELMTKRPWVLVSEEIFQTGTGKWAPYPNNAAAYYSYVIFRADLTVEGRDASKGGSPDAYPIVRTGWWSFSDKETALAHNNIFMEIMKSPFAIEELSATKLVLVGEERGYSNVNKFRYTYAHP